MGSKGGKVIFVVDVESTMKQDNPDSDITEIVQLGLVRLCLETLQPQFSMDFLIKPQQTDVGAALEELTGITQKQVSENGLPIEYVFDTVRDVWNTHKHPWSSWGFYDKRMIDETTERHGLHRAFHKVHFDIKRMHWLIASGAVGRARGLQRALTLEGMEFMGKPHSAADDAMNAARILAMMVERGRLDAPTG